MKKSVKTAGVVALSAVLACGALGALAGCGGGGSGEPIGDKDTLTVSIFCNAADATTNQKICDQWAAEYNRKNGTSIKVRLTNNTDKTNYFDTLKNEWSTGTTADIIYLSPKYVKAYAENGNILDLSEYLSVEGLKDSFRYEDGSSKIDDVWQNGISYYGYIKGKKNEYLMGQPIHEQDGKMVNAAGEEVGLYGLPKDYSNFSTGYNRKFFSDTLKQAYTTTKPNQGGTAVKAPTGEGTSELVSGKNYAHGTNQDKCIVYAADGEYYNPYTGAKQTAKKGEAANVINVGVPTTYYPYNFFRFDSYRSAVAGKDPVALMSQQFDGYTVTIPGFPNDEMEITQDDFNAVYENPATLADMNVPYNNKIGHVTYTYAEYGALLWACTYYLNTFAWDADNEGYGGMTSKVMENNAEVTKHLTVYGGEQYEGIAGAAGSVLYLLPWLAANDADLINNYSTLTSQKGIENGVAEDLNFTGTGWKDKAGKATYDATKKTLAGTEVTKKIQFGHDSQNFIETYAAFLAIGSDWNANPSGDTTDTDRANNGWAYFRTGRSICYGAGSWDAATRNDVDQSILDFGQMPTPVAEKYALYSSIKDANYQRAVYANDPAKAVAGSADEGKQLTDAKLAAAGTKVYKTSADDKTILYNQIRRQDKWAARMDTVAYAVAAKVKDYPDDHKWKEQAAVSLTAYLTINPDAQVELLYGGAQLPNFVSQCKEFVNYQDESLRTTGAFKDMLTPEGFADTPAGQGKAVWDRYYTIAKEMANLAQAKSDKTVKQFMEEKGYSDIKYDHSYENTKFVDFTGDGVARTAFAMKILRMVTYRADDRDINIRMQYGLNAVRDSSMYTYEDGWMSPIDARSDTNHMLAYTTKNPITKDSDVTLLNSDGTSNCIQMNPTVKTVPGTDKAWSYYTPAVWCLTKAPTAQELLWTAITEEINAMAGK